RPLIDVPRWAARIFTLAMTSSSSWTVTFRFMPTGYDVDHSNLRGFDQDVRVEARPVARVAGRAGLVDDHQQCVAVAVEPHLAHVLDVPGGVALDPVVLAAA